MSRFLSVCVPLILAMVVLPARPARAQTTPPVDPHAGHQMPTHAMTLEPLQLPASREGSGTSWLPDASPMHGVHRTLGPWQSMMHGVLFVHGISERGSRGDRQFGSTNWFMFMAHRQAGARGRLGLRTMLSGEAVTVGRCGYPNLLASGELCDGEPLHDRQHPHDLFMELAVTYERGLTDALGLQTYAGLAGEPALGPVAFPHRPSAFPHLLAPITHHWLDSTHVTFGVVTAGLYGKRWKAEASVFNGREPDDERFDFDLDRMDSYAARLSYLPSDRWALQISSGQLTEAEAGHDGEPRVDVSRTTASATYHRPRGDATWATTLAWGVNREDGESTSAVLVETTFGLAPRHSLFGRLEVAQKSAHDLSVPESAGEVFTITKAIAGYAHEWTGRGSLVPGAGVAVSLSLTPAALRPFYDERVTPGVAVFVTLRPARSMNH